MACPKCGNDTIEILEENAGGTFGRVTGGIAVIAFGIGYLGIPLLAIALIAGGVAMMCKKTKTIKCNSCGYNKVIS